MSVYLYIDGNGTVSGFPADSVVKKGDTLVLVATAMDGSIFCGWNTGQFTTQNPLVIGINSSITIHALFSSRPTDMVLIRARDSIFTMGSSLAGVNAYEKPAHQVKLTNDYYMEAREVTKGLYAAVMSGTGGSAVFSTAGEDSLPVTNITWYDAVLFCNSRSKLAGYDTVYSYTARCVLSGECPYVLENLEIHYDRFGYRLPTEAEWEYAARAGSDDIFYWGSDTQYAADHAWYAENAGNRLHVPGLKLPNGYGLYDMSGNVAEWVNDWLGYYKDSTYVDPVGPVHQTQEQFVESGNRPIKSGSYRLSSAYLRPSVRKGPYPVMAATTQIDIGFRTAMGAFKAPANIPEVIVNDSLNARIACYKSDLNDNIGTSYMKVAFVYSTGSGNCKCAIVDFTQSPVKIVSCSGDSSVHAPTISPDGSFIAWGSKGEGTSGTGTVSVRSLADGFPLVSSCKGFLPRWWVDLQSRDTFLIYTSGASSNDLNAWYSEKTYRQKIAGGVLQGNAEELWGTGSYHGGLSSDGRFLGTANPRAKLVDLQLGDTNLFYFVPPGNGRTDTPQVCNLSMSPSRTNPGEALFLDFGYNGVSTLLNKPYGFHGVIFIANTILLSDRHVSGWFEAPSGYDQWDFTEFTNHPGMIIAVAQTAVEGDTDAVMIINRKDSSCTEILKGMNLRDVCAWIDPSKVAETEDPFGYFGKYDVPIQTAGHVTLARKLRLLWHERKNVSCVAIGNSPMLYGFDPHAITTLPTINVAWFQNCIGGSVTVAMQYVLNIVPNLKVLLIDLDASYFSVDSRVLPRLTGLYYTKGYELDSSHNFYRDSIPQTVIEKAAVFSSDQWNGFDLNGAFTDSIIGEGWGEPIIEGTDYSLDDSIVKVNIAMFEALIAEAAARDVEVVAINFPQNPHYKDTEMAGRAGPRHATFQLMADMINELTRNHANFHFYDANNYGNHDYSSEEAMDTNHLNSRGGKKLAMRVDSLLQTIIK